MSKLTAASQPLQTPKVLFQARIRLEFKLKHDDLVTFVMVHTFSLKRHTFFPGLSTYATIPLLDVCNHLFHWPKISNCRSAKLNAYRFHQICLIGIYVRTLPSKRSSPPLAEEHEEQYEKECFLHCRFGPTSFLRARLCEL